jgi:Domain of unknown function (DUF305)
MVLLSRSFLRKRAISLATTASVAATSLVFAHGVTPTHQINRTMPIQYVADRSAVSDEASFLSENESATSKMMADMTVKATGDVDRDFVAMMVPHHQGAVDMAKAELKYGHNEQLRRLAQAIIVTQQHKISAMHRALGDEQPSSSASPAEPGAHQGMSMPQLRAGPQQG